MAESRTPAGRQVAKEDMRHFLLFAPLSRYFVSLLYVNVRLRELRAVSAYNNK